MTDPIIDAQKTVAQLIHKLAQPASDDMVAAGWTVGARLGVLEALRRAQRELAGGKLEALDGLSRSLDHRGIHGDLADKAAEAEALLLRARREFSGDT